MYTPIVKKVPLALSILANKNVTQLWSNIIIIKESKQTIHYIFNFSLLCSHYVADFTKNLELHLMLVSNLLKTKFWHTQINVPKIGTPTLKTVFSTPDIYYVISIIVIPFRAYSYNSISRLWVTCWPIELCKDKDFASWFAVLQDVGQEYFTIALKTCNHLCLLHFLLVLAGASYSFNPTNNI